MCFFCLACPASPASLFGSCTRSLTVCYLWWNEVTGLVEGRLIIYFIPIIYPHIYLPWSCLWDHLTNCAVVENTPWNLSLLVTGARLARQAFNWLLWTMCATGLQPADNHTVTFRGWELPSVYKKDIILCCCCCYSIALHKCKWESGLRRVKLSLYLLLSSPLTYLLVPPCGSQRTRLLPKQQTGGGTRGRWEKETWSEDFCKIFHLKHFRFDLISVNARLITGPSGLTVGWRGACYLKILLAEKPDIPALPHLVVWTQDIENCGSPSSNWCLPLRSSEKSLDISEAQRALKKQLGQTSGSSHFPECRSVAAGPRALPSRSPGLVMPGSCWEHRRAWQFHGYFEQKCHFCSPPSQSCSL